MKPFNLQEMIAGKKVITGSHIPVQHFVVFDNIRIGCPNICAQIGDKVQLFYTDGKSVNSCDFDLFMKTEKKSGWIGVYYTDPSFCPVTTHGVYSSESMAASMAPRGAEIIKIEWEE